MNVLMVCIAAVLTLAVGGTAFVWGYRRSPRWFKSNEPYWLADPADDWSSPFWLVIILLPRRIRFILAGFVVLALVILSGVLFFAAIAYPARGVGLLTVLWMGGLTLALWSGAATLCGTVWERMVRSRKPAD